MSLHSTAFIINPGGSTACGTNTEMPPRQAPEYNKQRTGANFTVRSANSPYYTPSHSLGGTKPTPSFQEKGQSTEEARDRVRQVTHGATNGRKKEEHTLLGNRGATESRSSVRGQYETKADLPDRLTELHQNGAPAFDRSENPSFESHGRSEGKKYSSQSRSTSSDWRAELRGSDFSARADTSVMAARGDKPAGELEKGQTEVEHVRRAVKGHTFPSRMRSQSEHSLVIETSQGPKGQSIMERIEKLYGSAGHNKAEEQGKIRAFPTSVTAADQQKPYKWAEGGFLSGERNGLWTPQKDKCSDSSGFVGRYRRPSGGQWQEQMQGRYLEEGGGFWGKGSGTRSLDRARSRNTVAAQIRSARAAADITAEPTSKGCSKEQPSVFKDLFALREKNASESNDQSKANHREERGERVAEKGAKESNTDEDVFEPYSVKRFSKTLLPPTSASVRNKINQFEALSQRAQVPEPRRAFSVPAQSTTRAFGGFRDRYAGTKEGEDPGDKPEKKSEEAGPKFWSDRALSVDESGLRFRREEKQHNGVVGKKLTEISLGEDSDKYSKLKRSLELPVSAGPQPCRESLYGNKTDSSGASGPGEANRRCVTDSSASPTAPQVMSPAADDDKTPTNTPPTNSPFLPPTKQPDISTPDAKTNLSMWLKTPDAESPPVPRPLATSSHSSLPGLVPADVGVFPNGKTAFRDLNAWVAGIHSDSVWNDEDDDCEDDDESTQKDEDSNYDSDSGESSVTVTSKESDHKSFSIRLSELCNFAEVEDDFENDSDEWQSSGRRSVSLCSDVSALSCVSVMPSEELDRLLDDVRSLGDNNLQDYNDVQVVVLHKEMGVGLGFSLAGGVDQNKPVTVHKVFHSGVAAQEGSIREGDHVLSINGTALCDCAHWEALRVLRRAKSREMAVVVLRRGDVSGFPIPVQGTKQGASRTPFIETGQRVCVCVEKNNRDLGFTLEGGVGSSQGDRPLIVQKIFHGGPVDKVSPGDEVVDIEGVSTVGMSRLEAWTLIRKLAPGPVNVVLHRPQHLET